MANQQLAKQEAAAWMTGARAAELTYPGIFGLAEQEMLRAGKATLDHQQINNIAMSYLHTCLSPEGLLAVAEAGHTPDAYAAHVDRLAYSKMGNVIGLSCKFRLMQQVISMDPTIAEALAYDPKHPDAWVGDDGDPLPTDLLERLPFNTFVLVPNVGEVSSFLVEYDNYYRNQHGVRAPCLNVLARVPQADGSVIMMNGATVLTPGLSLADMIKRTTSLFNQTVSGFGMPEAAYDDAKQAVAQVAHFTVLSQVLPYLLYLCADNRELDGDEPPPARLVKTKRGPRIFPRERPAILEAGIRVGAAIRSSGGASGEPSEGRTGSSVTPHLRRAHWHAFWTGPRDEPEKRKKRINFLPPIPVMVSKFSDMAPVVRPASV